VVYGWEAVSALLDAANTPAGIFLDAVSGVR